MSFSMLRNFTEDLKDPATMMYKNLKNNIESAVSISKKLLYYTKLLYLLVLSQTNKRKNK